MEPTDGTQRKSVSKKGNLRKEVDAMRANFTKIVLSNTDEKKTVSCGSRVVPGVRSAAQVAWK